ncbi:MAG: hypothetical protein ABL927_12350 [Bdellovibrionales bacterium]
MEDHNINIKLTSLPYEKRKGSIFRWTLLPYLIILIVVGFNTDYDGFVSMSGFLLLLFLLDFFRRERWIRYSLESLETDSSGINLIYLDKDNLLSTSIPWEKLSVTMGSTFTNSPRKLISFKTDSNIVASFYATDNFDNEKIKDLYHRIKKLKLDYT